MSAMPYVSDVDVLNEVPESLKRLLRYIARAFYSIGVSRPYMRPGATKGTLRRENENSFFDVLCLIIFHWSFSF